MTPTVDSPSAAQALGASVLRGLHRVESAVAVTGFTLVVVALLADLAGREFFGQGLFGAQRIAVYATAVAGLLGFAVVVGLGGHMRPTSLDRVFPARWDPAVNRLADLVSAGLCIMLGLLAWRFVASSMALGERNVVLGILVWPVQAVLPWLFASSALRYLIHALLPALRPRESEVTL